MLQDRLPPEAQAALKEAQEKLGSLVDLLVGNESDSYEMSLHYHRWHNVVAHYLGGSLEDRGLNAYVGTPEVVLAKLGGEPWGIATFLPGDPDWERVLRWLAPECPEQQHRLLAPDQASDLLKDGGARRVDLIRSPLWGVFSCSPGVWWDFLWEREGSWTQGSVRHEELIAAFSDSADCGG